MENAQGSSKGMSLVQIREQLARQAAEIGDRIGKPGGDFIKVQTDKSFKTPDQAVSKGPLSAVVVDFVSGNFFFDRPYKEGEIIPPACFAIGPNPKALVPSPNSPAKVGGKNGECEDCEHNQFGTKGAGKACSNTRLLALAIPGDSENKFYLLKVSATGTKAWDAYAKGLADDGLDPIQVVTEIFFDDALKYASLRFAKVDDNADLEKHFGLQKAARERLLTEPDVSQYVPPKGGAAKKK